MIEPKIDIVPLAAAPEEDFTAHYFSVREGMAKRNLGEPAQRLLEVLLELSFVAGKTEAPVFSLELLAKAAHIHRGNIRRVLDLLVKADVIVERCENVGGAAPARWMEVKPDWTAWKLPRRHTHAEEAAAEHALKTLLEHPAPGQLELIERPPDFGAQLSRAFSAATLVPSTSESRVVPSTSDQKWAIVPRTTPDVRTRAGEEHVRHGTEHEHVPRGGDEKQKSDPSRTGELDTLSIHQLEDRLSPEQEHTLEQLGELPGVTGPRFKRTWLLRLLDGKHASVASAAGDALHKKRTGFKPRIGWGEYVNDLYHRSRNALRRTGEKLRLLFFV